MAVLEGLQEVNRGKNVEKKSKIVSFGGEYGWEGLILQNVPLIAPFKDKKILREE